MRLLFASIVACSLLAGCASITPAPTAPTAVRPYQENIELAGRLSVLYQNMGKEEALHGNFTWHQTPERTGINLLSPLGQTVAAIEVTPDGASLRQSGNSPPRFAPEVDTLVANTLGWPLPIAGLRTWLQGFGTKADGGRFITSPAASEVTTRDGWHIRYVTWQDDGSSRPKRIDLERDTPQAGNVAVRVVIDSWQ